MPALLERSVRSARRLASVIAALMARMPGRARRCAGHRRRQWHGFRNVCAGLLRSPARWGVFARHVAILTMLSLLWEFAQMPLYTLWQTGTTREIVYAALHCTLGDAMIGGASLLVALLIVGGAGWPRERWGAVLAATVAIGLGYTVFSEWLNVGLRASWAYSDLMPVVPPFGTGLTPLLQWLILPPVAYRLATRGIAQAEERSA